MANLETENGFKFIVSTPTFDALARRDVRTTVRRHVMDHVQKNKRKKALTAISTSHRAPQNTPSTSIRTTQLADDSISPLAGTAPSGQLIKVRLKEFKQSPRNEWLGAGRSDPFIAYPIILNARAKQLIDCLFHDRSGRSAPYRDAWFKSSLSDASSFHQMLCLAATYFESIKNLQKPTGTRESLLHHAHALSLVKTQLSNVPTIKQSGIISTIIGFACYYHMLGNLEAWKYHVLALRKVVLLLGGFDIVYENESLSILITSVDISGSCDLDARPNFPFPVSLINRISLSSAEDSCDLWYCNTGIGRLKIICGPPLKVILYDLALETWNLRSKIARAKSHTYSDCLYIVHNISPLLHRLLSVHPEFTDKVAEMQEVIRLTCIIYLISIRRAFGILTAQAIIQLDKLKAILTAWEEAAVVRCMWEDLECDWFEAWVFAIGLGAVQQCEEMREWFDIRLKMTLKKGWTVKDFTRNVHDFLWIEEVHGSMLQRKLALK